MKPSPQLAALFLLAVGGVLSAVGAILADQLGATVATVYAVLIALLVGSAAVRAKQRALARAEPAGHSCACCSAEPFTGVEVI